MKTKLTFCAIIICFLIGPLKGQEESRKLIYYVETGIDFIGCQAPEKDYIRADVNPFYWDDVTDNVKGLLYKAYLGVKVEKRLLKNKVGILGGLRYTMMESSIGKTGYWSGSSEFFYLQFRQSGDTKEFLKVKEIIQRSDYLGIPLEVRLYPFIDRVFNIYFKIGASFNFNVRSSSDVVFFNDEMEQFEEEAAKIIEDPYPFYSSLNAAVGLKLGRQTKPGVNFEFGVPAFMLTSGSSGFVSPKMGCGFQLNIRLPL